MCSLACNLKGQQQVIYFREARAASCCRAYPQTMTQHFSGLQQIWQQEREQLEQGHRVASCEICWRAEDLGQTSYRQQFPGAFDLRIELNMDNLCNHMCSYCGPRFSSRWQQDLAEHGPYRQIPASDQTHMLPVAQAATHAESFLMQLREWLQSCQRPVTLALLGGEPLMQIESLDRLFDLDLGAHVRFEIITNLNPPSTRFLERILDRWQDRTDHLRFLISLDATPGFNHVVRHGFDADRFYRCLDLVQRSGCDRSIISVISALNVLDLPHYLPWLERQGLEADFFSLNNPRSLQPANVARSLREQIRQSLPQARDLVHEQLALPDTSDLDRFACYHYLIQYFDRTGQRPGAIDHALFQQFWQDLSQYSRSK